MFRTALALAALALSLTAAAAASARTLAAPHLLEKSGPLSTAPGTVLHDRELASGKATGRTAFPPAADPEGDGSTDCSARMKAKEKASRTQCSAALRESPTLAAPADGLDRPDIRR